MDQLTDSDRINISPNGFKETEIGPIPAGWKVVRLGNSEYYHQDETI